LAPRIAKGLNTIVLHLSPLIFPSQISLNLSHFYLKISNSYSVLLQAPNEIH
jgi:hypothetical protein